MMRVVATTAALLFTTLHPSASAAASSGGSPGSLLEPTVKRHAGFLSQAACNELIALGEEKGFTVDAESIDDDEENYNVISQSIEVFERDDGITSPGIWKALEPWIPKLTNLVKESIDKNTDRRYYPNEPDRIPQLGWVFFRKYSPNAERKSLKLHVDSNMHTLNIALNDDFSGGGLFYVKPPTLQEPSNDDRPDIPDEYKSYGWLNELQRKNTSDLVFPPLGTGDVLIHNFTVWHAVAPIEVGTRYSFVLFYDMDNPAVRDDFYYAMEEDIFPVTFYHEISDVDVDLAFVMIDEETGEEEGMEVMEENMPPFEELPLETYDGHVFRALISGTETVVSEFVMKEEREMYTIVMKDGLKDEL